MDSRPRANVENVETCLAGRATLFLTISRGRKEREKHKFFAETCFWVRLHWPPPNPALEIDCIAYSEASERASECVCVCVELMSVCVVTLQWERYLQLA